MLWRIRWFEFPPSPKENRCRIHDPRLNCCSCCSCCSLVVVVSGSSWWRRRGRGRSREEDRRSSDGDNDNGDDSYVTIPSCTFGCERGSWRQSLILFPRYRIKERFCNLTGIVQFGNNTTPCNWSTANSRVLLLGLPLSLPTTLWSGKHSGCDSSRYEWSLGRRVASLWSPLLQLLLLLLLPLSTSCSSSIAIVFIRVCTLKNETSKQHWINIHPEWTLEENL